MPEIFHGSAALLNHDGPQPVVTIGNFDGVHRGHQALLKRLVERARELEGPALVYTFEPAPRRVLQPERCPPRIVTLQDKLEMLGELGVDQVVLEEFTLEFGQHPPEWFVQSILMERLRPAAMVVGYDFRYGRGRKGNAETLSAQLPDLPIETVPALTDDAIVSSSRIREAVAEGRVEAAARGLGRPYHLTGAVIHGDHRGRDLGFPTANLDVNAELLPAAGVYAVRAEVGGVSHPAIANLGVRPTFGGHRYAVEVHLLDGEHALYDKTLRVHFVAHIRSEMRFDGPAALIDQIRADIAQARERLG